MNAPTSSNIALTAETSSKSGNFAFYGSRSRLTKSAATEARPTAPASAGAVANCFVNVEPATSRACQRRPVVLVNVEAAGHIVGSGIVAKQHRSRSFDQLASLRRAQAGGVVPGGPDCAVRPTFAAPKRPPATHQRPPARPQHVITGRFYVTTCTRCSPCSGAYGEKIIYIHAPFRMFPIGRRARV